jgi:outer membrane protein assembly factor BamB
MSNDKAATRGLLAGGLVVGVIALGIVLWVKSNATDPDPDEDIAVVDGRPFPAPPARPSAVTDDYRPAAPAHAAAAPAPVPGSKGGSDQPMFGGTPARNMVNLTDKGITDKPDPEGPALKWKAELGSRAYGGPVIAGGKVFVGTNNERPRNPRDARKTPDGEVEPIDKGILMCFDEKTGEFLWQAVHDKHPAGQVTDWPKEGICSTPVVDGDKVYYVSNRCTVVCADVNGLANGNQGVTTEKYKDKTDVDILWEYDMMRELNVFPHNMAACSPLVAGGLIYVVTANGVDEGHFNIPSVEAPSFIALSAADGTLAWKSSLPGKWIMHGQWANPAYAEIGGVKQVIFPGGDGWLYAFEPTKGELLWKFDANPKDSVYKLGGEGTRNDFIGTPVVHDGKVYIGVGQDPEHFTGIAHFWCLDPAGKKGDISPTVVENGEKQPDGSVKGAETKNPNSGVVWHYGGEDKRPNVPRDFVFGRTMSTACVVDGILYISELQGQIHCLDAKTGKLFWVYDTKGAIWGSPYYVDGKVFLATEGGDLFVWKHTTTPKKIDPYDNPDAKDQKEYRKAMLAKRKQVEEAYLLGKVEFDAAIRSTPVVANGVLYVMTEKTLYAFVKK